MISTQKYLAITGIVAFVLLAFVLNQEKSQFVIETDVLPILLSHEHRAEDKITEHANYLKSEKIIVPRDLWVTAFEIEIQNAPVIMAHHAVLVRLDRKNPICPHGPLEIYWGSPDKPAKSRTELSPPHGVFLPKGAELFLSVMLHNPLPPAGPGGTYKDVSLKLIMDVARGHEERTRHAEYYRLHIDETPCRTATQTFTVSPGANHFVKEGGQALGNPARYTFERAGTIIWIRGHVHPWRGGEKLSAYLNGELIAEFVPQSIGLEPWEKVLPARENTSIKVEKGNTITITATYSNSDLTPMNDAMGTFGFLFVPNE